MIINTTLDLFKYGTPPKKSELTDKEFQDHIIKSPTKKQHNDAFSMGRALLKVSEAEKNKMANEWMTNSGREKGGRSLDDEIRKGKEEWLKKQKEKKLADKKLIKWALEESPEPIVKNPHLKKAIAAQQDAKQHLKIAKKPKPKPVPLEWDWRLAPWYDFPEDDDWLEKPEEPYPWEEETKIPIEEKIKRFAQAKRSNIKTPKRRKEKENFGLAYLMGE